jgi:hypothetical protein
MNIQDDYDLEASFVSNKYENTHARPLNARKHRQWLTLNRFWKIFNFNLRTKRSNIRKISSNCVVSEPSSKFQSSGPNRSADQSIQLDRAKTLSTLAIPMDTPYAEDNSHALVLLPPPVGGLCWDKDRLQSPLHPPRIANRNTTSSTTTSIATEITFLQTSISSSLGTCEINTPPIFARDRWSTELGHANFTILPEPYMPNTSDQDSLHQFISDWSRARMIFMKYEYDIILHYGPTSNTVRFTKQKWSDIEAQWRKNKDMAVNTKSGLTTSIEPIPLTTLSVLDDGKFPGLGDQDIIGPMVQTYSRVEARSRKITIKHLTKCFFQLGLV